TNLFWYYYRLKPGCIPRRMFFITLFVSQAQLFFAYAYMCTLPVVDSMFNFLLGTVLSRTISSFFSKNDFADFLMAVEDKNSAIVETIECIRMQSDDGEALRDFEIIPISENENDDSTTIVTPIEVGFFKKLIAFFFFLNIENGKFVYKVNYLDARNLNIKESIDVYVENGFLKLEAGQIIYVGKNKLKRCINLTDHWPLKIEYEVIDIVDHGLLKIVKSDYGFKVVYMKTPEATKFIDLTEHGLLNYIVYGHKK
ncbi:10273_t:CDS:2, partial [Racocetra persica]